MSGQKGRWIDTHIHLDQYPDAEAIQMIQNMGCHGVSHLVAVSMHAASCQRTAELAKLSQGHVLAAFGYHPEQPLPTDNELAELLAWIDCHQEETAAIGEVGLPYYERQQALERGEGFERGGYMELLEPFVQRAAAWDKPIILHAVYDDAPIVCDLLERYSVKKTHFHWFKGDRRTIERIAANGHYISFTPDISYESEIQAVARLVPLQLALSETDGPWPFEGPYEGQATVPWMVRDVTAAWGKLHGIDPEEAAAQLYHNACQLYGIIER